VPIGPNSGHEVPCLTVVVRRNEAETTAIAGGTDVMAVGLYMLRDEATAVASLRLSVIEMGLARARATPVSSGPRLRHRS
jgi:hypothetical protein